MALIWGVMGSWGSHGLAACPGKEAPEEEEHAGASQPVSQRPGAPPGGVGEPLPSLHPCTLPRP